MNKPPIYYKLYFLLKYFYKINHNIKKEFKYSIGEDTISLMWQCLDLIIAINLLDRNKRKEKIQNLSFIFDKLKFRIRMMQEIGAINKKQMVYLYSEYLNEIGLMIGGWMKWANT